MVDREILRAQKELLKATKAIKGSNIYKTGLLDGIKASIEITEAIMKKAGKKVD